MFEFLNRITGLVHDAPFGVGDQHVVLTERNARLERLGETKGHDVVAENDRIFLTAMPVHFVDDLADLFLAKEAVDHREGNSRVLRQKGADFHTAGRGFHTLGHRVAFGVLRLTTGQDFRMQRDDALMQSMLDL